MPFRTVVPDNSALIAAFFRERHSAYAAPLLEAIRLRQVDAVAPTLLMTEFLNACRRKVEGRTPIPRSAVDSIVSDFLSLPITWQPVEEIALFAWGLYQPGGVEAADAFYLHVSMTWQAELWTADQGLHGRGLSRYPNIHNLTTKPFR